MMFFLRFINELILFVKVVFVSILVVFWKFVVEIKFEFCMVVLVMFKSCVFVKVGFGFVFLIGLFLSVLICELICFRICLGIIVFFLKLLLFFGLEIFRYLVSLLFWWWKLKWFIINFGSRLVLLVDLIFIFCNIWVMMILMCLLLIFICWLW